MSSQLPAWHLYCGDLWKDNEFRLCGWQAQNLWLRMLILLHEHSPRGEFRFSSGAAMTDEQVAKLCEMPIADFAVLSDELYRNNVFSRIAGAIVSRRMVRERQVSEMKSKAGQKGNDVRWHNGSQHDRTETSQEIATPCSSSSSSSSSSSISEEKRSLAMTMKKSSMAVTDDVWLQSLRTNPLYSGIDIDVQIKKAQSWLQVNAPRRQFTRKYFGDWLTREIGKKPVAVGLLGKPCQSRVKHGLEFVPCNKPAVEMIGTRPVCDEHRPKKEAP